jgi:hypothetical protein
MSKILFLFVLLISTSNYSFSQLFFNPITYRVVDIQNVNLAQQDFDLAISTDSLKNITAKSTKKHKSPKLALDEAYFNAIVDNQIDVLVNPIYSINQTKRFLFFFGGNCEAEITGYAGYYKQLVYKKDKKESDDCNDESFDCFLKKLEKFAKNNNQEFSEEQEIKILNGCDDCKNDKEPLKLLIVTTKKKSIIDSYLKSSN